MTDVIMPQMGESIAEGTVLKWMKNVGDKIQRDEPLFEISTDKVDAEIPAPAAGILREIRVQVGQTVAVNTVVGVIQAEGEAATSAPAPAPLAPTPVAPPAVGAATLPPPPTVRISVPPSPPPVPPVSGVPVPPRVSGVPVPPPVSGVPAPPPASSAPVPPPLPHSFTRPSPGTASGVPAPPPLTAAPPPRAAAPAQPAAPAAAGSTQPAPALTAPATDTPAGQSQPKKPEMTVEDLRQTRSSPVVRNIAAEHGVDIRSVAGTGISGRVTKQDILGHIETRPAAPEAAAADAPTQALPLPAAPAEGGAPATPFMPAFKPGERVEIVPMSPIRKRTAEHMTLSKRISAHVSTVWEIDMTRVDQLRRKHRPTYQERHGVKLTYLPFIMKATVSALKAFPMLNASVDGDKIVYKKDVNLGLAVALDWGLIVPVIRSADEKSVLGLARAGVDLAERARSRQLKVDEIQGGTFTITNPGVFGSLFGTPILNQPQVGILAIGTIEKRPVVRDDAIAVRTMAYFALTFDHRIVDGADADRFMALLKQTLQEFDESGL